MLYKPEFMHVRTLLHIIFSLILLCALSPMAWAETQDETLTLMGQPVVKDSVAGRLPRQLSRTAENITVVTATEIEALNAHTLVDILATIPGSSFKTWSALVMVASPASRVQTLVMYWCCLMAFFSTT